MTKYRKTLAVQSKLRRDGKISIPELREMFGLSYSEAFRGIEELIDHGWISEKPVGQFYHAFTERLCLREIQRREILPLCRSLTKVQILIMDEFMKKGRMFREDIDDLADGYDDNNIVLGRMMNDRLVCRVDDEYMLCISRTVVEIFCDVFSSYSMMGRMENAVRKDGTTAKDIIRKFNVLFEK